MRDYIFERYPAASDVVIDNGVFIVIQGEPVFIGTEADVQRMMNFERDVEELLILETL